ncbi:hypothetical protein QBC40DRAFT_299593 [Triangularia verruculosa]|uniref:RGS domain-containing protein n=1 Tax=Triangularia verruculosa TaxID=2587418 RepID=A0AAN6XAV3_9PEZI|nr:hypothetical protein QBC40DRAFT_299593 [Triangularia verruculosa]
MADFEATNQLPQPTTPQRQMSAELCFERVVKDQAASPCSLSDFTLYLTHSENCPEVLQFFLWYWDYVQRWSQLLPRQKALSPAWDPEKAAEGPRAAKFVTYSHKRSRSLKMEKVLAVMEMGSQQLDKEIDIARSRSGSASSTITAASTVSSVSQQSQPKTPRTPSSMSGILSPTESTKSSSWQPFTIQPNHPELTRVTKLFLSSPSTLKPLSQQDREQCLRAVQHTTHPTALLPAFMSVECTLRNLLHPKFIKHSLQNANSPRLVFTAIIGIISIALGLVLQAILILSKQTPYLRVLALLFLWPGLTGIFAAVRGVDIILHFKGRRQLRPWEPISLPLFHEAPADEAKTGHESSTTSTTKFAATAAGEQSRQDADWEEQYKQRSWREKVFDTTARVESKPLILMQDRIVFLSALWAGVLASGLAVGVLFIPGRNLF